MTAFMIESPISEFPGSKPTNLWAGLVFDTETVKNVVLDGISRLVGKSEEGEMIQSPGTPDHRSTSLSTQALAVWRASSRKRLGEALMTMGWSKAVLPEAKTSIRHPPRGVAKLGNGVFSW